MDLINLISLPSTHRKRRTNHTRYSYHTRPLLSTLIYIRKISVSIGSFRSHICSVSGYSYKTHILHIISKIMMKYIDLNRIKLNHLFISKFFQWQNQQNKRTLLLLVIRISNYSSGRNFF
jgi:hypothetical protein